MVRFVLKNIIYEYNKNIQLKIRMKKDERTVDGPQLQVGSWKNKHRRIFTVSP